jgi:hypothetical protein
LGKGSAVNYKRSAQKDGRCDKFRSGANVSQRGVFMLLKPWTRGQTKATTSWRNWRFYPNRQRKHALTLKSRSSVGTSPDLLPELRDGVRLVLSIARLLVAKHLSQNMPGRPA